MKSEYIAYAGKAIFIPAKEKPVEGIRVLDEKVVRGLHSVREIKHHDSLDESLKPMANAIWLRLVFMAGYNDTFYPYEEFSKYISETGMNKAYLISLCTTKEIENFLYYKTYDKDVAKAFMYKNPVAVYKGLVHWFDSVQNCYCRDFVDNLYKWLVAFIKHPAYSFIAMKEEDPLLRILLEDQQFNYGHSNIEENRARLNYAFKCHLNGISFNGSYTPPRLNIKFGQETVGLLEEFYNEEKDNYSLNEILSFFKYYYNNFYRVSGDISNSDNDAFLNLLFDISKRIETQTELYHFAYLFSCFYKSQCFMKKLVIRNKVKSLVKNLAKVFPHKDIAGICLYLGV